MQYAVCKVHNMSAQQPARQGKENEMKEGEEEQS